MAGIFDDGPLVPAFSWDGMAAGTTVTGVLAKPHEDTQQTDIDGNLKWFDSEKTQPMMQAVLTLQTDYRAFEYTSDAARDKMRETGVDDDGLRKLYVRGSMKQPSLQRGLKDALRKAGVRGAPEVGATISVTFLKKTPIPGTKFKQNDFAVTYTSPTAASLAKVESQLASVGSGGNVFDGQADSDEPPF